MPVFGWACLCVLQMFFVSANVEVNHFIIHTQNIRLLLLQKCFCYIIICNLPALISSLVAVLREILTVHWHIV